jgi:hypothetical protein
MKESKFKVFLGKVIAIVKKKDHKQIERIKKQRIAIFNAVYSLHDFLLLGNENLNPKYLEFLSKLDEKTESFLEADPRQIAFTVLKNFFPKVNEVFLKNLIDFVFKDKIDTDD